MSLYPLQAHPDQQNMSLYPLQVHAHCTVSRWPVCRSAQGNLIMTLYLIPGTQNMSLYLIPGPEKIQWHRTLQSTHCALYYWEKLFSVAPQTVGFHLRWCPWSWRNCDTGAMMRAKPHIPEMRQNQSGDEYQADDQVAGRPTISPLPLLQGGALLFALLILIALEMYILFFSL